MIKKTLYFGSPVFLRSKDKQLVIEKRINNSNLEQRTDEELNSYESRTIPIEDIGILIIDHFGVTITQYCLSQLIENNTGVIVCNDSHHPAGMFLPIDGNSVQSERFKKQIKATKPLLKQLWQQTVSAKIRNQATLLKIRGKKYANLVSWAKKVRSGDPENYEARAAIYYWNNLFCGNINFQRDRYGEPPNNLLNYGYAVLRAIIARGLVSTGLIPTIGIHHRNKYNAYCLADDIMEPYRPFVDRIVSSIADEDVDLYGLDTQIKKKLLAIATEDVVIGGSKSVLMAAVQKTTSSLYRCFEKSKNKLIYPTMPEE
jgi:CRISPR-associated protein Cas1